MTRPSPDPVVEAVVGKLRSRSAAGIAKYGTRLADSPESTLAFLRHAQEEALDFANYLELLIQRVERLPGVDHG
jgi:hypothetical protein